MATEMACYPGIMAIKKKRPMPRPGLVRGTDPEGVGI
jgi:hypothetical protein